jgi:hypothetical protein
MSSAGTERRDDLVHGGICPICDEPFTDGYDEVDTDTDRNDDLVTDGGYIDGPESHLTPDANQCSAKGCIRTVTLVPGCDTLCEPHRKDPPNGFETIEADTSEGGDRSDE